MRLAEHILVAVLGLAPVVPRAGLDPRNTDALIGRLADSNPRAAEASWSLLWALPREWTPAQLDAILNWLPAAPPALQPVVAERLPTLLDSLVLPRLDRGEPAFVAAETASLQGLYATGSEPLLLNLLACDRLLREVPISPAWFHDWLGRPDEVGLAALRVAPARMGAPALVTLLEADWDQASPAWRLASVQLACSAPEYLAWLRPHAAGESEIAQRARTTLQLYSPDPKERRATVEIIGKANGAEVMSTLVAAMRDPDESVAAAALAVFWENPRPYSADVMEDMLHLLPTVSLPMRRTIVENLPTIASVIEQRRGSLHLAMLSPPDLAIIQSLYDSDDRRILRNVLADYFYFNGLTLSTDHLRRWLALPDEVSLKALPLAPVTADAPAVLAAMEERWQRASTAWKLQAVQISWGSPDYAAWLEGHEERGEVGEMAQLTGLMLSGLTPSKMAEVRGRLTTPDALHRWAQLLPALGPAASGLAWAEMQPGGLLTADLIPYCRAYRIPVPPELAAPLIDDRRMAVRSFAAQLITRAAPEQAKAWCASEYPDVRALGARFAERSVLEDLLVDERPEVRLAAIVRWANENWPDLDKTLRYGLADPLLTDPLLLATVNLAQCQAALAAWGANEPQRSKLTSAKSLPHRPFPLPWPVR